MGKLKTMTVGNGGNNGASGSGSQSRLSRLPSTVKGRDSQASDADPKVLARAIDAVIDAGGLLSFGRTTDGGAISLFIKDGKDTSRLYSSDAETLENNLQQLIDLFDGA